MTTVLLGNPSPQMQVNGTSAPAEHINQSVTRVEMRPDFDDGDVVDLALGTSNDRMLTMIGRSLDKASKKYAIGILEVEQLLSVHTGGDAPSYVACPDDPDFAKALGKHFDCPVGEPTNLLTNAGRDAFHAQHLSTAAQPAAFNYMAVSSSAAAALATNTTLPSEIAVGSGSSAGGGLLRAQGTFAHTAGTNTSTLTKTFTANANDTLPVTLPKIGILNAASAGTLGYETLLNASATLSAVGDNVAVTETVTAG